MATSQPPESDDVVEAAYADDSDQSSKEKQSPGHYPSNTDECLNIDLTESPPPPPRLETCLEPRPPYIVEEGAGSPKDIQKKLMRKVNLMSSNGEAGLQCSGEIPRVPSTDQSDTPPPSPSPSGQEVEDEGSSLSSEKLDSTETQKPKVFLSMFKRSVIVVGLVTCECDCDLLLCTFRKGSSTTKTLAASSTSGLILEKRPR